MCSFSAGGIFILTGVAARTTAGPAVTLSYIVGGILASCTALTYCELAADYPLAGGSFNVQSTAPFFPFLRHIGFIVSEESTPLHHSVSTENATDERSGAQCTTENNHQECSKAPRHHSPVFSYFLTTVEV